MKHTVLLLIKAYQLALSPLLGNRCRFFPSCSEYMLKAVEKYPLPKGILLGIKRLLKCHPLHPGGVDPVP